jgi:uncharacterized BrkB/YihY/UPF0761 family membrane protein
MMQYFPFTRTFHRKRFFTNSALILLFGAEFTQVYANMYGSQIEPHSAMISIANGGGFYPARNIVGRDLLHLGPEAKHHRIFQS